MGRVCRLSHDEGMIEENISTYIQKLQVSNPRPPFLGSLRLSQFSILLMVGFRLRIKLVPATRTRTLYLPPLLAMCTQQACPLFARSLSAWGYTATGWSTSYLDPLPSSPPNRITVYSTWCTVRFSPLHSSLFFPLFLFRRPRDRARLTAGCPSSSSSNSNGSCTPSACPTPPHSKRSWKKTLGDLEKPLNTISPLSKRILLFSFPFS